MGRYEAVTWPCQSDGSAPAREGSDSSGFDYSRPPWEVKPRVGTNRAGTADRRRRRVKPISIVVAKPSKDRRDGSTV